MVRNGLAYRFTRAIVRAPADTIADGLRASDIGDPDIALFSAEHEIYCDALRAAGLDVTRLPALNAFPDSVFVEDPALALPEGAVLLRPGAASRAGEGEHLAQTLGLMTTLVRLPGQGFIDGGDILVTDREVIVGLSARTDRTGYAALKTVLEAWGYPSRCVQPPEGLLHLKTGCSPIDGETILMTAGLFRSGLFDDYDRIELPEGDEAAANAIRVNGDLLISTGFPRTAEMLAADGYNVVEIPTSQAALLDGGLSCMSLRF